jgi:two-component system sensor histidine kinase KdpD
MNQLYLSYALVIPQLSLSYRLANQLRAQVLSLRATNSVSLQLQELERKLSSCVDIEQVLNVAKQHLETSLNAKV